MLLAGDVLEDCDELSVNSDICMGHAVAFFLIASTINIYIGYRDLSVVFDIFSKGWAILYYGRCPPEKMTFLSRTALAFHLSGTLAWPGRYIRNGILEPEELAQLPAFIQVWVKLAAGCTLAACVGLLVFCGVILFLE